MPRPGPWRRPKPRAGKLGRFLVLCGVLATGFSSLAMQPAPVLMSSAADVQGRASVVDGDTLEIHGTRIRLHGVDAPESGQSCQDASGSWPCGRRAANALSDWIGSRTVACDRRDTDRYGRMVAVCRVGGEDLGRWLVSNGWAVAYVRYSASYVPAELSARSRRVGIWRGTFQNPEEWRRARP